MSHMLLVVCSPSAQNRAAEHQAHYDTQSTWPNKTHDHKQSNRPIKQKNSQKNASKQTHNPSNVNVTKSDETKKNHASNDIPSSHTQPLAHESTPQCIHPALLQKRPNHSSKLDNNSQRLQHTQNQGGHTVT